MVRTGDHGRSCPAAARGRTSQHREDPVHSASSSVRQAMRSTVSRRRTILPLLASALLLSGLFGAQTALASHPEVSLSSSNFEIDTNANLKVDDPAPSIDWANVT